MHTGRRRKTKRRMTRRRHARRHRRPPRPRNGVEPPASRQRFLQGQEVDGLVLDLTHVNSNTMILVLDATNVTSNTRINVLDSTNLIFGQMMHPITHMHTHFLQLKQTFPEMYENRTSCEVPFNDVVQECVYIEKSQSDCERANIYMFIYSGL